MLYWQDALELEPTADGIPLNVREELFQARLSRPPLLQLLYCKFLILRKFRSHPDQRVSVSALKTDYLAGLYNINEANTNCPKYHRVFI